MDNKRQQDNNVEELRILGNRSTISDTKLLDIAKLKIDKKLSATSVYLYFMLIPYIVGYSYKIKLTATELSKEVGLPVDNVYKYLKELERAELILTKKDESNRLSVYMNPNYVSKGKKCYSYVKDMFDDLNRCNVIENIPLSMRKEKEENIVYDVGY